MALIRDEGWINDHTYLIDAVHEGLRRGHAVYLLKSRDGGTCLIDAGTKDSARVIHEKLAALDAWPVDKIILTHSHWDHTQGIAYLREKAGESGHVPTVLASEKAMPYLADQSYNICFGTDQAPYLDIDDVQGLSDGDRIDVGRDLTVTVVDTPGHMVDHISIWDEETGNIAVGDAIGMNWTDGFIVSNPNSRFWSEEDYLHSLDTLRALNVRTIGLAHFGCLTGEDARGFLDGSVSTYRTWMTVFAENTARIHDIPFLVEALWERQYSRFPEKLKVLILPGLSEAVEMAAGAYAEQHP